MLSQKLSKAGMITWFCSALVMSTTFSLSTVLKVPTSSFKSSMAIPFGFSARSIRVMCSNRGSLRRIPVFSNSYSAPDARCIVDCLCNVLYWSSTSKNSPTEAFPSSVRHTSNIMARYSSGLLIKYHYHNICVPYFKFITRLCFMYFYCLWEIILGFIAHL